MATPLETYQQQYNASQEHQNNLKWQNASINDVANKYGFRFDRGYADQQAETVASGQRNAYNDQSRQNQTLYDQTIRDINSGLKDGVIGTENNFFQNYLKQRQNQVNSGINAGMQADQDLRLGMNQQSVLAGLYRDANNNKAKEKDRYNNEVQRISEALAQVEKERQSTAEKLYQELLSQGYGLLGQERSWFNTLDNQRYGQYQDQIGNWYKEQDLALRKQEAARAAAARAAQQKAAQDAALKAAQQSNLAKQLQNYNATKAKQAVTPAQRYVSTIAPIDNWARNSLSPTVSNMVRSNSYSIANTPYLTAYDKMRMLTGGR
jgi:hypothetical protein